MPWLRAAPPAKDCKGLRRQRGPPAALQPLTDTWQHRGLGPAGPKWGTATQSRTDWLHPQPAQTAPCPQLQTPPKRAHSPGSIWLSPHCHQPTL